MITSRHRDIAGGLAAQDASGPAPWLRLPVGYVIRAACRSGAWRVPSGAVSLPRVPERDQQEPRSPVQSLAGGARRRTGVYPNSTVTIRICADTNSCR